MGTPAGVIELGVTFMLFSSSQAQHRFIIGTDRSPNWFR
jgi:hypothetical protein